MTDTTKTPRFKLPYLDPSQEQPEVKINEAWNIIDANLGAGGSDTGSDTGASDTSSDVTPELPPPSPIIIVRNMREARRYPQPPGAPLQKTGVSPGTYSLSTVVVDAYGRVSFAASGGAGGAGVPGTIADLMLWWESDDINGTLGNPVFRLRDRTPWLGGILAANTTVGGATLDTTQLNGLNVVKWGASATVSPYQLVNSLLIAPTANPNATFFVVCKPLTSTGAQAFIGAPAGSGALAFYLNGTSGTPKLSLVKTGIANIGTATPSWTVGSWFQANATYNGSTGAYAFRQARTAAGSGTGATTAGGSSAAGCTQLGSDSTSTNFLGGASMAALLAYNRILSPTEITNVENYLFAKWGV